MNMGLDYLFVWVYGWSTPGAALATLCRSGVTAAGGWLIFSSGLFTLRLPLKTAGQLLGTDPADRGGAFRYYPDAQPVAGADQSLLRLYGGGRGDRVLCVHFLCDLDRIPSFAGGWAMAASS